MIDDEIEIPEEYYGVALVEKLPRIIEDWKKTILTVSHNNDVPAIASFFTILGQITKNFIMIPRGKNVEDSRLHFCWIQTSGTGKSTLWNFMSPVTKQLNDKINKFEGTHGIPIDEDGNELFPHNHYDNFDIIDYTDAALIGYYDRYDNPDFDADDPQSKKFIYKRVAGSLEGNGIAHWDEFEYSGVFKQSQHKENAVVYMNTFMNTMGGDAFIITKKLKEGEVVECRCERSVWATTYPPKHLKNIIADKGVLQRMLVFVREVSEDEQHEMRMAQLKQSGIRDESTQDVSKFVNALFVLYKDVKARYLEVGNDPFKTIEYGEGFSDALVNEYIKMRNYAKSCRPEIREIAQNFITRLNGQLMKLSVLCCIADRRDMKNPTEGFVVTPRHVRQAYILTQQCYSTLVEWLEQSLKVQKESLMEKSKKVEFIQICKSLPKDENGFISKNDLLEGVQRIANISQASAYRYWKNLQHKFEQDKVGRSVLVRLKEGDETQ